MPSGVRANSLLVVAQPSGLVRSLDEAVEYLDRYGVPRRCVNDSDARRLVKRGFSLSSLEVVRAVYDRQQNGPVDAENDEDQEEPSHEVELVDGPLSLDEKLALERAREAKMRRRQAMLLEIRDRKRQLLVSQHEQILERVQLWHEALALDPEAEVTSNNTAFSPSNKARAYIDDDGNIRRKSIVENDLSSEPGSPEKAGTLLSTIAAAVVATPRKSLVLEFMQLMLED